MIDAIIISDLHIGAENCQTEQLLEFLEWIECDKLIINGDAVENLEVKLKKKHWKILSSLRKLSKRIPVIWCVGNHDEPNPDSIAHILGVELVDKYILQSGNKTICFLHGHQFDKFLAKHKYLTIAADFIYNLLQKIDPSHNWARFVKHSSKTFLRATEQIKIGALKMLEKNGYDIICCGHTHNPKEDDLGIYFNSGCWTENNSCTYLEIKDGIVKLRVFEPFRKNMNFPVDN